MDILFIVNIKTLKEFWRTLTFENKLNVVIAVLTFISVFVSVYKYKSQKAIEERKFKEKSKKKYMSYKCSFEKIPVHCRMLLEGTTVYKSDINIL
ncbi:MAG TPA: hypothetical protein VK061_00950 [Bacillota bacterium]|nr:hypothetical protein [Bacillota bacterium]